MRNLVTLVILVLITISTMAQPVVRGGRVYVGDQQEIRVEGQPHNFYAWHWNHLYIDSPEQYFLGNYSSYLNYRFFNIPYSYPGITVRPPYPINANGTAKEIIFRLDSQTPDAANFNGTIIFYGDFHPAEHWYTGPSSRNIDNLAHADVQWLDGITARVKFEDEKWGGDQSYDDSVFLVKGVHPGVDLRVKNFKYYVLNSDTTNGMDTVSGLPVAANAIIRAEFDVENAGIAPMIFPFDVGLFLSADANITKKDPKLALVTIDTGLLPSELKHVSVGPIALESLIIGKRITGSARIGTIIDPSNAIAEISRANNSNSRNSHSEVVIDSGFYRESSEFADDWIQSFIYDPCDEWERMSPNRSFSYNGFSSRAAAEKSLERANFYPASSIVEPGVYRLLSERGELSYRFGIDLDGEFWRTEAIIVHEGNLYYIKTQAATENYPYQSIIHGEPNPYAIGSFSWTRYCRLWHRAY